MLRISHHHRFTVFVFLFLGTISPSFAQYFPETGPEALHQRALDVRSRLNVLSIALQPGYEDLAGLAHYRLAKGARIVSAYVTNGEASESDVRGEYPNQLAAKRRAEAAGALALLGGEEYFLNMPDLGAVRDTSVVRELWDADTLRLRLNKLLSDLKPDVILIARNWATDGMSPEIIVLKDEVLRAVRRLLPVADKNKLGTMGGIFGWVVDRVLIETGSPLGLKVPVEQVHPLWKRSYLAIGDEAGKLYESRAVQRKFWYGTGDSRPAISYENVFPTTKRALASVIDGLPVQAPQMLKGVDAAIRDLAKTLYGGNLSPVARTQAQRSVAALIGSVDALLSQPLLLDFRGRKISMQWKLSLESLRVALLGVTVQFTLEPTIVTDKQLTLLRIDTVTGTKPGDSLLVYFPAVDQKWVIDEGSQKMMALKLHEPYRLLSPAALDRDLPAAINGLTQPTRGKAFSFFVLGKSKIRERNFIFRGTVRMLYSPRFSAEVLTPIVRTIPSERVLVRITNHSRDGVRDSVQVNDTLAVAPKQQFRLNIKDQSEIDTLVLQWKKPLPEGTYLVPISIVDKMVAQFAARAFQVSVDTNIVVAVLTGLTDSPVTESLRRLGVRAKVVYETGRLPEALAKCRVAIVDRRALTLVNASAAAIPLLKEFVRSGGHLIVLAQDAAVWNAAPIMEGLQLNTSNAWGEATEVQYEQTLDLFSRPNKIAATDWEDWFYRRVHNVLSGPALESAKRLLVTSEVKSPMIVEWNIGTGVLTYVDLALHPQLLNIHPGAFRLLANLVGY